MPDTALYKGVAVNRASATASYAYNVPALTLTIDADPIRPPLGAVIDVPLLKGTERVTVQLRGRCKAARTATSRTTPRSKTSK